MSVKAPQLTTRKELTLDEIKTKGDKEASQAPRVDIDHVHRSQNQKMKEDAHIPILMFVKAPQLTTRKNLHWCPDFLETFLPTLTTFKNGKYNIMVCELIMELLSLGCRTSSHPSVPMCYWKLISDSD